MLIELKNIPAEVKRGLREWTRVWFERAAAAGFIPVPYHPDPAMLTRLRQYFHAGLEPDEAVHACFVQMH